mmetsp:Transcript_95156/g.273996  ORF Transcript_95156/g.273996 Transcript_95156/m.273996 type:complete len:255 (+) Transcript_95156:175-939(+)
MVYTLVEDQSRLIFAEFVRNASPRMAGRTLSSKPDGPASRRTWLKRSACRYMIGRTRHFGGAIPLASVRHLHLHLPLLLDNGLSTASAVPLLFHRRRKSFLRCRAPRHQHRRVAPTRGSLGCCCLHCLLVQLLHASDPSDHDGGRRFDHRRRRIPYTGLSLEHRGTGGAWLRLKRPHLWPDLGRLDPAGQLFRSRCQLFRTQLHERFQRRKNTILVFLVTNPDTRQALAESLRRHKLLERRARKVLANGFLIFR